jgi:hypothetical protein
MTRTLVGLLVCVGLLACGCYKSEAKPKANPGGIQVNVPGVNISVDPERGAEVHAPGVNLKASRDGAEVEAPNVSLKAGSEGSELNVSGKGDK